MKVSKSEKTVTYVFLIFMAIISIAPFVYVLLTALKSSDQIYNIKEVIPSSITFQNFKTVITESNFAKYFVNSTKITIVTLAISMTLSVSAAYGLTRYNVFGANKIKMIVLFTKMFPSILLCIPFYTIIRNLGLIDTHVSLVLIYCAFILPFAMWNVCTFFKQIPWDLEEAALIDGCDKTQAFFKVILPLLKPGLFATGLYCFILSWDEYMYSNILINTTVKKTIQVGIRDFIGEYATDWGALMAAVILGTLPIIIAFAFAQKYLIGGLSTGAVKG